jgi:DNA-binding GntR family transcriptional regulator
VDDRIIARLRQEILELDYSPGELLNVRRIAEALSVSATPVREALIVLEAEGLVRREPGSHVRVSEVSLEDVRNIMEVRFLMSFHTASLVAQRITADEIAQLHELVGKMRSETDQRELARLDASIHDLISRSTRNKALVKVEETLRNQVVRLWAIVGRDDSYWRKVVEGWERLVEALRQRDVETCRKMLQLHLHLFSEQLAQTITRSEYALKEVT